MSDLWKAVKEELHIWSDLGLVLPVWWRDDDAIEPTSLLTELERFAAEFAIPVHLAVIPAHAYSELGSVIATTKYLIPIVHGFAHENHEPKTVKKSEFGVNRLLSETRCDIVDGQAKLKRIFGDALTPMFVPPWNRITSGCFTDLSAVGYRAVSTFTPRKTAIAAPGLTFINTHIDPIDWHGSRSLVDETTLLSQTLAILQARRAGSQDNDEPFGYLTHHLVHDQEIWGFTKKFMEILLQGPVRIWNASELKEGH